MTRRLAGVDLARGLAVFGMFAAHLLVIPHSMRRSLRPGSISSTGGPRSCSRRSRGLDRSDDRCAGERGQQPATGRTLVVARRRLVVRAAIIWGIGCC
jgi:hypothetical protein